MYFKKLEIFGFKSFADKTALNFEPGITAIVGPNGCGKSNIFDSIRWVLGEQSAKELRGNSMTDVIFNGTEKKPSLGFAEVSLFFDNKERSLNVDADEVRVTRRLFRSGESQYLINDASSRLKDIHEILYGTGMGTSAYSLIQQGKVEQVVNAKPEDRRNIIDEAAGITKYKAKKKEALSKLKSTEDNLLRVNDIVVEVKRQIGSIERQARKAQRFKDEYERLKNLEVKNAYLQIDQLDERKAAMESKLGSFKENEKKIVQECEELSAELTREINYLGEIDEKINENNSTQIKLDGQIDVSDKQLSFNEEKLESLSQSAEKLSDQKVSLFDRCKNQQQKIEDFQNSIKSLTESIQFNETAVNDKKQELGDIEKAIFSSRNEIKENEEKILNLTSTQVNVRNALTEIMKKLQGALARKRRLVVESEKVHSEKLQIDQKLQNIQYQIQTLKGTIHELNKQNDEEQSVLQKRIEVLTQLDETINDLEKRKVFLNSQKEFIEKLQTQYDDIPDPVIEGRIFTSNPPKDHHTGIIGKVRGVHHVEGDKLAQLKSSLHDQGAGELYEIICETKFIELDPIQITAEIEAISSTICQKHTQKRNLEEQLQMLRSEISTLVETIQVKEKECSIFEAQSNDVREESLKLSNELETVDGELLEVKETVEQTKAKEDELNYQLDTITQDISWAQNEIKEKQESITQKVQQKEEINVALAQNETELNSNKEKLKDQEEHFADFSESLDGWLEEIKTIDDEVNQAKARKEEIISEKESLKVKIEEINKEKEALVVVKQELQTTKESQGNKINSLREKINEAESSIERIKQSIHKEQLNEQELGFGEQGVRDRLLQSYKIDLNKIDKETFLGNYTFKASDQDINEAEQPRLVAKKTLIHLLKKIPQINKQEELFGEEFQAELVRLRKKCDSYGNVNLSAMDEYEELKGRFEFLTSQQSDLLEAKSQLMSTISKINRSTRQMFMDTFTRVSEEFRIYFRMLFGGGEAELILLDHENVLESGIDIIARPPGKKQQNMSLLSGGEKSLTAIALIFGVFKVKPSPFCVLDEIDAALDEANVGRFSFLLRDFSKIAQFIVITHNKKTISSSDVMYGITMPETGCSRIVSVKLAEDKKKEAVPAGA